VDVVEAEGRQEVAARVEELIRAHADADEVEFLGAQFDAGLAWVHFPVGAGGLGLRPALQVEVDDRLRAASRKYDWMRNPMGIGMIGPVLAAWGTEEQRAHLRRIFTAEDIWCQLFSEPGAGSDVATLATRAERRDDSWVVDGQKVWTTAAHRARFGLLLARTDPDVPKHRGITAFVVDMRAPGVTVRPLRQMSGAADFNEVYLDDVVVPDTARVGDVGRGWDVAVSTLANERVSIGAVVGPRGSGPISFVVDGWRGIEDPARDRARLDQVMRSWIDAEVLRLSSLRAAEARARGAAGPEGSILKLAQALWTQRMMNTRVALTGAQGMLVPTYDGSVDAFEDPQLYFLRAQATTIAGGTTEIMKNILGERVLGLPAEARVDRDLAWRDIPKSGSVPSQPKSTSTTRGGQP
jgi:alkylation response protein AidB-like acyl-CoA dehydrogenase